MSSESVGNKGRRNGGEEMTRGREGRKERKEESGGGRAEMWK